MSSVVPKLPPAFNPIDLGEFIRSRHDEDPRPRVTFLLGAGCSRSAGIPLASEIVAELRREASRNPFLRDAGAPPAGKSEYAYLMGKLGAPQERALLLKDFIARAKNGQGSTRINWTHLLLAAMVEENYVNRILTTNFDPLIVDALAVMGQPIRTYDLSTTGKYCPGTLDPASIIYLHGQMHSLFLANTDEEVDRLRSLYPPVLTEAVQESFLIVVGYSGDSDPVMDALIALPTFPRGVWWSHFSKSGSPPGEGVRRLFERHGSDCHLAQGDDADTFMRKLVLDGMRLRLPDEIRTPLAAVRLALERITSFPGDGLRPDPLAGALQLLRRAEQFVKIDEDGDLLDPGCGKPILTQESPRAELCSLALISALHTAAISRDWEEFDRLRKDVPANPSSLISQAVALNLLARASSMLKEGSAEGLLGFLEESEKHGLSAALQPWLAATRAMACLNQAKQSKGTKEAGHLLQQAEEYCADALRMKPDMHHALNTWGVVLTEQAKLKSDSREAADHLFTAAGQKFTEALQIKPDMYEALDNWGHTLFEHAKIYGDTSEADRLFGEAGRKCTEAIRIKPDAYVVYANWAMVLNARGKLKRNTLEADALFREATEKCVEALRIKPDADGALDTWGIALCYRADLKGDSAEADSLLAEGIEKFTQAARIKPSVEGLCNWALGLRKLARRKGNSIEMDHLFAEAYEKYAQALRLQPDSHEVLRPWGTALAEQGQLKRDSVEADRLFTEAAEKLAEALRVDPDCPRTLFDTACVSALRKDAEAAVADLRRWAKHDSAASRKRIDEDSDFDAIRDNAEFLRFRETLPP